MRRLRLAVRKRRFKYVHGADQCDGKPKTRQARAAKRAFQEAELPDSMHRCHYSGAHKNAQAILSVRSPLHTRSPRQISASLVHGRNSAFTTYSDKCSTLNNSDHRKAALSSELNEVPGTVSDPWNDPDHSDPPRRRYCGHHRGCIVRHRGSGVRPDERAR